MMFKRVIDILHFAKQHETEIVLDGDQLQVKLPKNRSIDKDFIDEIRKNKQAIIDFLKNHQRSFSASHAIAKFDRDVVTRVPLSFSQERLWIIDRLEGSLHYHVPAALRLTGALNKIALSNALLKIVERHEALRTVFYEEDGNAYQRIKDSYGWRLEMVDKPEYKENAAGLSAYIQHLVSEPFNLSHDYMVRAMLVSVDKDEHVLVVTMHHIASDAWSLSVIVKEVAEFYRAESLGEQTSVAPLQVQYADYALWQRNYLKDAVLDDKINYWKNKLQDTAPLQLPEDFQRPAIQSTSGAVTGFSVDKELLAKLYDLGRREDVTLFMTLLAVFKVLLYRYTGEQDICVGTPVANRNQAELEDIVGFFVNTLALRDNIDGNAPFLQLLQQVRETTLEAYNHQDVPFEKVVEATVKERDVSRSPLFQVMFILQNTPEAKSLQLGELKLSQVSFEKHYAKFDITFSITETAGTLHAAVEYNTDLYQASSIERMIVHYKELLRAAAIDPNEATGALKMLTSPEERQLTVEFNANELTYNPGNMLALFSVQVAKTPGNAALMFNGKQVSYEELDKLSNQVAHYLSSLGVKEEALVPICLERGTEMVVYMLGILKSGGAYVPVDPEYPAERINFILEDTNAGIIVCSKTSLLKLPDLRQVKIINVDNDRNLISTFPVSDLSPDILPHHLAYVIYTSGSTGQPKGVMIEHKNLYSFLCWCRVEFASANFETVYASTSICFDLSVFEVFYPLSVGKRVRILENGLQIGSYLLEDNSVLINSVPAVVDSLLKEGNDLTNLTVVNMAGEPIPAQVQQRLDKDKLEIRNLYGPTETTTYSSVYHIKDNGPVLIGKPIANTSIYVLNDQKQLCPAGVTGEIFIGGDGVARGYLNRKELTAEKFIQNPFDETANGLIYQTGDLGKWHLDGNLEYIGRKDSQVKIRGFRIEMGEIEYLIRQSGMVEHSVVLAKQDREGNKRLVGYVVVKGDFKKDKLNEYLKAKLPVYMIPAIWVELEHLPLTPNGKLDRKALSEPDVNNLPNKKYVAPRTETEEKMVKVWQDLLGVARVGIEDNFFELGGDSITSIQMVSRLRHKEIFLQPKDVFLYQSIEKLSSAIRQDTNLNTSGEQGLLTGLSGLLPIQQWFLNSEPREVNYFNQSILLKIEKVVTNETLQNALDLLTAHHDALRFKYAQKDGQWQQEYGSFRPLLLIEDLRTTAIENLSLSITTKAGHFQHTLHIEQGDLVRAVLFQTPQNDTHNRLLFIIHHLAIDGVSWRILLEDLDLILNKVVKTPGSATLTHKSSSYRQWFQSLETHSQNRNLLAGKDYWQKSILSYDTLPVDVEYNEPVKVKDINNYVIRLEENITLQLLQDVPKIYHTEINDLLVCALAHTICEWSNAEKIVIGLEGHGREVMGSDIDISHTLGWFTTIYPVVIPMESTSSISDRIKSTKEQLRKVPGKGLDFGILKYINKEEDLQGRDPWDIVFNYLGQSDNVIKESKWLKSAAESAGKSRSENLPVSEKFSVTGIIQQGRLIIDWSYSSKHYFKETVKELTNSFTNNLKKIVGHCLQQKRTFFTPADFGLQHDMSFNELDIFMDERTEGGRKRRDQLQAVYKLSSLQQGMLFHSLYDISSGAYIHQVACNLIGLDLENFKKSWEQIVSKHSILRTAFYYDAFSVPVQSVNKQAILPLEITDYSPLDKAEQQYLIDKYIRTDRSRGFDFKVAPLMRIALFRLNSDSYRMVWTYHHLLLDGWSMPLLFKEFLNNYETLFLHEEIGSHGEDLFEDYIRQIENRDKEQEKAHWENCIQNFKNSTLLPFIKHGIDRNKGIGNFKSIYFSANVQLTKLIENYARENRTTLNTIMQGVWALVLSKYTASNNVIFGVTVSGRPTTLTKVEERVGMYINTLPSFNKITPEQKIVDWLHLIQEQEVSSRQFQYSSLNDIKRWTGFEGDMFDTTLTFQNYPIGNVLNSRSWSLKVENILLQEQNNYPFSITISSGAEINIRFSFNTSLLEEEYVRKIQGHFLNAVQQMVTKPSGLVKEVSILTKDEEQQILNNFNHSIQAPQTGDIFINLFKRQVETIPGKTAIIFRNEKLTYGQLDQQSSQFAAYIRQQGVKQNMLVPVCLNAGIQMMVVILGIFKAGAAYVPVDPGYPGERINYILQQVKAEIIVSSKEIAHNFSGNVKKINSDIILPEISAKVVGEPVHVTSNDPAYVIFTSGSTGKPKGVLVNHSSLANYLVNSKTSYLNNDCPGSGTFTILPFTFDASLTGMFMPLVYGKSTVISSGQSYEVFEDPNLWKYAPYDFIKITPAHIPLLQAVMEDDYQRLLTKRLVIGGEELLPAHFNYFADNDIDIEIINEYGPTEATVGCSTFTFRTAHLNQFENNIPAGKPIDNTSMYILDGQGSLVPVGVAGEIYIGGAGVAAGYVNDPVITAERFIKDPFTATNALLYKSGDWGRWLPDGNVEYIGRTDDQVKIRGYRVELGEVQTAVMQTGLVTQAAILVREDKEGAKRLAAYVVANESFDKEELITHISAILPHYMVPAIWTRLDKMPLTTNGKMDKKALLELENSTSLSSSGEGEAPANELEAKLVTIWKELLDIDSISVNDDFFKIGGDSLLAVRMASYIERRLLVSVSVQVIFQFTTVSSLGKYLSLQANGNSQEKNTSAFELLDV